MTVDEYISLIEQELEDKLNLPGETLYSSVSTLQKGDIYFIGTNPGGDDKWTIKEDLIKLANRDITYNEYISGIWPNDNNKNPKPGEEKLQKKIQELFKKIDYDLTQVCASNLIFFTSKDIPALKPKMNGMNFDEVADLCWKVHEKILEIIQPKIFMAYGNSETDSPFSYLKRKFNISNSDIQNILIGHGQYKAKIFQTNNINFLFLPHLSRFNISNNEVYEWIKAKLNEEKCHQKKGKLAVISVNCK